MSHHCRPAVQSEVIVWARDIDKRPAKVVPQRNAPMVSDKLGNRISEFRDQVVQTHIQNSKIWIMFPNL
tara:strand:+ start:443 stop:649 length:207 start_codon:yes stop_codon:yes gene_type:complete